MRPSCRRQIADSLGPPLPGTGQAAVGDDGAHRPVCAIGGLHGHDRVAFVAFEVPVGGCKVGAVLQPEGLAVEGIGHDVEAGHDQRDGGGHAGDDDAGGHVVEYALAGGDDVMGGADALWAGSEVVGEQDAVAGVEVE